MSIKNGDNIEFFLGNESKYNVTKHGTALFFANDTKQLILDGLKYIPKKLSELTNDMGYITTSSTIKPSQVKTVAGDYTQGYVDLVTSRACNNTRVNMLFGFDAPYIDIEYSKDGGATWLDYGLSDFDKTTYFVQKRMDLFLGKANTPALNEAQGTNNRLRVTLTGERYCLINQFVIEVSTLGNKLVCDIEICKSGQENWTTLCSNFGLKGWSGYNSIHIADTFFNTNDKLRFTFRQTSVYANYSSAAILRIMGYGTSMHNWSNTRPFVQRMLKHDHAYSLDGNGIASFGQAISIQAQSGFAPLTVNSTLLCTSLNADLLDGKHLSEIKTDILASNRLTFTKQYHYGVFSTATKVGDIITGYTDSGSVLSALRDGGGTTNSFILGNYSSGVLFGGGDTVGTLSVAYHTPRIRFAGSNNGNFNWWLGLRGSNNKEYNLNNFLVDGGDASVNSLSVMTDATIDGALNVIGGTSADENGGYSIIAQQNVKIGGGLHGCSHIKNSTDTGVKITNTGITPTNLSELYKAVGFSYETWYTLYGVGMWVTGNGYGHIQVGRFDKTSVAYHLCLQEWGGNVGIGTASPTSRLTVNGTTSLLSTLSVTGATTIGSNLTVDAVAQVKELAVINNSLRLMLLALADANYIVSTNASYNTPNNLVICADNVKAIPLVKMYATTFEVTGAIKIGNATLSWDSANEMLKVDKGVYSTGAISAKGVSVTTYTSYDCVAQFGMYYQDVWTMQRTSDRNITAFGASTLPAQLDYQNITSGGELSITAPLFNGCKLCDIDVEYARFELFKDDNGYDGHDVMTLIPTDITNNTLTCRVYWDTDYYGDTPPYFCGFRFRVYKNVQHNE